MTDPEDALTPVEAARILGVSESTVRRYEDDTPQRAALLKPVRRLPGSGHRRYRRGDVEALRDAIAAGTAEDPAPGDAGSGGQ
jgi:DNA-binding transcriptional MerR regulator